jgi:prephenate dehydrogenase
VARPRPDPPPRRIAFLGFGLIAGSIALALRARGFGGSLVAWTPGRAGPRLGLAAGVLDEAPGTAEEALRDVDLVVLASPASQVLRDVGMVSGWAASGSSSPPSAGPTITDVASTKARIVERANAAGIPFVGGHPMAGRDASGFEAATPDLFVGRPWVVSPGTSARERDVERVEWLATAVGARPIRMTAADHDRLVAGISHAPLVLAAALVEAIAGAGSSPPDGDWAAARELAASGWADMTRLARGDPAMGAGILATNSAEVAARLRDVRRVLDEWIGVLDAKGLDGPDEARIRGRLESARGRLADASEGSGS